MRDSVYIEYIQEAYLHLSKVYMEDKLLEEVHFILFLPFPTHFLELVSICTRGEPGTLLSLLEC